MTNAGVAIGFGIAVLLMLAAGTAAVVTTKGKRDDEAGADGLVPADPMAIATRNGVSLNVEALARMIRSEHGNDSEIVRIATAHVAMNESRARGQSIAQLLLAPQGKFGAQWTGMTVNGKFRVKYASTRLPSQAIDRKLADDVIAKRVGDPTGGATQFDSPRAQRVLHAKKPETNPTPEEVERRRLAAGATKVLLAGVAEDQIRFWRYA